MTRLPSVATLGIFVRNRRLDGWSEERIVDTLKQRMKWDKIDVQTLDEINKQRYDALRDFLEELS